MNTKSIQLLEYDKIKEVLEQYALSEPGKQIIRNLEPYVDQDRIEKMLLETTEARAIVNRSASVPIHSLTGIENILGKLGKGGVLFPEELEAVCGLLVEGRKLKRFMEDKEVVAPLVSTYALSMYELNDVVDEIEKCIESGRVSDRASAALSKLRKRMTILENKIRTKLDSILRSSSYKSYIQDQLVSVRNGRFVIPIKSEHRKNVDGTVLDSSASGSTIFVEPAEVKRLQDELNLLQIEEEKEIYKILSMLTGLVESYQREITINIETMVHYDFLFAKGKYSKALDANTVILNTEKKIHILKGKHPLIGRSAVPLDFNIGDDYKALVITGPNTGGKTVALKTVGLLTMMVQSGLHVPVEKGSEFGIFTDVLVDIGDGQSIEQSLSTFSSHIKNIISIMECADPYSLVIVDELGAGTDPGEGMGLAIAILETIYKKGAIILATTHYSEIKEFAENQPGFKNGCMEFDINTLKPMYRLKIGKAGESNAFLIALRLGMEKEIIERAHLITYKEEKQYGTFLEEIQVEDVKDEKTIEEHIQQIEKQKQVQVVQKVKEQQKKVGPSFKLGDCVYVATMERTGIVCEVENGKGEVGVMVMKKKFKINKKRLKLYIEGDELYPDDYDFDIVFKSKDDRKKNHLMNKRHVEGLKIEMEK